MSKWNPRITPKDRNAIKGALRRAFARSELHHGVLRAAIIKHSDPSRPRVKTWAICNVCKKPDAKSYFTVDHIDSVIPAHTTFEEMGADATIDRVWCEPSNLQAICDACHLIKSNEEKAIKKAIRDANKPPKVKKQRKKKK